MTENDTTWDPQQYGLFSGERATPFFDLVSRIEAQSPRRVVDLGCGTGSLTRTLAQRWPEAEIVGIDSSPEMIESANAAANPENVHFVRGDIAGWNPGEADDVVVTNAALQWIPQHRELLAEWCIALPPGGWFAMQVPGMGRMPSHTLVRELAADPQWKSQLKDAVRPETRVGEPADYLARMLAAGMEARAWETTYSQLLPGPDPVLEWLRGTRLLPVSAALTPRDFAEFEAYLRVRLRVVYPATAFGTVFPFRRVFAVGQRPSR